MCACEAASASTKKLYVCACCVCVWWCHHVCMDLLRGYMYRYTYIHRSMYCRERGAIDVLKCADIFAKVLQKCIFLQEMCHFLCECVCMYTYTYIHIHIYI